MSAATPSVIRLPRDTSAQHAARPAFVGSDPLTYGEFTARVETVAARLLSLGTRTGDRIAVWMDKQPRYAEAIVAALEAGCAYVPLDGGQPVSRVRTILADAEPVVLFTDAHHAALLGDDDLPASVTTVVALGDALPDTVGGTPVAPWESWEQGCAGRVTLLPSLTPGDLAAILYTSGSTGTPKGVQISHGALANFVAWARDELDVGPDDVFAGHASFNFDLSTFDLFTALSCGAAVWIVPDAATKDVTALAEGIRRHRITVWYSVPSVLHLLTSSAALTPEHAASLRYVLFAGEVFPVPQLRALGELLPPGTPLYNLYGPTETNVCTYHRVRPEDLHRATPVPIGLPITGAVTTVVDDAGRTVREPGAIGELHVSGVCVTPGYWRRAEEPVSTAHCRGVHPTGDLVSYEEDGRLVYRGRKDRMVKLSGYRVELGEIEAAALRHPRIAEAAVLLDGAGPKARLRLYYTLCEGADRIGLVELKQHCARHLPTYMVPHGAVRLDRMPLNPNGKTDYRRLGLDTPPRPAAPLGTAR